MRPTLVTKPAFVVVGLRLRTKAMSPEIPALWGRFVPRIAEIASLTEPRVTYGLMGNFDRATCELDYLAGVAVSNIATLPAGMTRWEVPAATYAVYEMTIPTIGETLKKIYGEWLPASSCRTAAGTQFERYGESFDAADPASVFSLYLPVEQPV